MVSSIIISKKAFEYLKSGVEMCKSRNFGKTFRGTGESEKSEIQNYSNLSLESLKIRVKPVPRQQSIESSAEKYFAKDYKEEYYNIHESKRNLNDATEKEDIRKSGVRLKSQISFTEKKMALLNNKLDLNLVREQMEKYPVLKMDIVTSLEKRMTSKGLNQKG
jgi:hypothetical protein